MPGTGGTHALELETLRGVLKRQYHASLAMLRDAVERCPEDLWERRGHLNAYWQVAYHALYFTHLYLQREVSEFRPWAQHQGDVQHPDGLHAPEDPDSELPLLPEPYSKDQVLDYLRECDAMVDEAVERLDLLSAESGFPWYRLSKLEHQLINLRHVQHHAAQLADRLRAGAGIGVRWVSSARDAG